MAPPGSVHYSYCFFPAYVSVSVGEFRSSRYAQVSEGAVCEKRSFGNRKLGMEGDFTTMSVSMSCIDLDMNAISSDTYLNILRHVLPHQLNFYNRLTLV